MKIHVKNQLSVSIQFCCGNKEYELKPEQKVIVEVNDEDCLYLDQIDGQKPKCWNPEEGKPYPLCQGNPSEQCAECGLFKDFTDGIIGY